MKRIVRISAFILALAMAAALCVSCGKNEATRETADADLLARVLERGYVTVATEGDWSPWTYHDESGKLTGFDVELARLIAKELGVEARFEETAWDSILAGVDAGRFDMACNGVSYTEARAEKYSFSTPYAYTGAVIIVRDDNTSIKTVEDLKGKTTANTASSTYALLAEEAGAVVTPVDSLADTLNLVADGRVEATVNSRETIEAYMAQHPAAPLKIAGEVPGEQMVIPVQKSADTESFLARIDQILDTLRQNGKLTALSRTFFGEDLTQAPGAEQ